MAYTTVELKNGNVIIELDAIANIAGITAMSCYGVVGMAYKSKTDEFASLLRREKLSKGISVEYKEDKLNIDLHIIVDYGVNINAICDSIKNRVTYQVNLITGIEVNNVDIYVDGFRLQDIE